MAEETEVVQPQEPKAEPPQSLQERMAKSVEPQWAAATKDSSTAEPSAEEPQPAEPGGAEAKAVEPAPETPVVEPPRDDVPFTAEQLKDKSFWGRLDKAGWEKAERLHPVETHLVKAAQAAASRIVNEARSAKPEPNPSQEPEAEPELDAETESLLQSLDSFEPKERLKAIQKLTAKVVAETPEVKAAREAQQSKAILAQAETLAVNGSEEHGLPAMPELSQLSAEELDKAYAADPEAKLLAQMGTPLAVAMAMRKVGATVLTARRAAAVKDQAEQEKLRRNANTPPSNAVQPGAGGPVPQGKPTVQQYVNAKWGEVSSRSR